MKALRFFRACRRPALFLARCCLLPVALGLLGGCVSLYVPTLPAPPLVAKGQVEVVASLRSISTLGLAAAWAPTRHLLLLGEAAFEETDGSISSRRVSIEYHDYHRQGSLGLGYYRVPTATFPLYAALLGGVGFASASQHAVDDAFGPFPPYYYGLYRAGYRRYYGQLYLAEPRPTGLTVGGLVRGSLVDYTRLTFEGVGFSPVSRAFFEPMLFLRAGQGALRLQASVGFSVPFVSSPESSATSLTSPISSLVGFGLVFRPDLLKRRQ